MTLHNKKNLILHRQTLLINRAFQLKWTLVIVLVGVSIASFLSYFIIKLSMENTDLLAMEGEMHAIATRFDTNVVFLLAGFVLVVALVLFGLGIMLTHRIVGPIFVISSYLKELARGEVPQLRSLREQDEMKNFYNAFTQMLCTVKKNNVEEYKLLCEIAEYLNKTPSVDSLGIREKINQLVKKKEKWNKD